MTSTLGRLVTLDVGDLDAVTALEREAQVVPWTRQALAEEFAHPDAWVGGIRVDDHLAAYVVWRLNVDELWVLNIATHPGHRRQGHARALMQAYQAHPSSTAARSLWLEVREHNSGARALYEALGYGGVGRRPDYYAGIDASAPREAAILMRRAVPAPGHVVVDV